jgi:excisionase family DNA binding protein
MPRTAASRETLTMGQLARRWGISRDHVRQLVASGSLPGVFTIPSAGRYGAAIKIPLASVIQAETTDWSLVPQREGEARPKRPQRRSNSGPALKHFPKLRATLEPAAESPEDAED